MGRATHISVVKQTNKEQAQKATAFAFFINQYSNYEFKDKDKMHWKYAKHK